jgi:heme A synthase
MVVLGLLGMILLGISGAIAALGDTLFPSESILSGLTQDLSPDSHIFLRLRVFHPVIAAVVGTYLFFLAVIQSNLHSAKIPRILAYLLPGLIFTQLIAGVINVVLLAPVWLQMLHLLLADLIWVLLVIFGVELNQIHHQMPFEKMDQDRLIDTVSEHVV